MDDLGSWLEGLGLGEWAATFEAERIDLEVLAELSEQDLRELGLPLGHRRKLLKAIDALSSGVPVSASFRDETPPTAEKVVEAPAIAARPWRPEAERRQLTVMFVDLVGSTALARRLDPEDMRDVIRAYQDACAGVITRFDGHVAKYMGDGVLAYFGWPRAHEEDAERALHAGLDLVQAVSMLVAPNGQSLAGRVGIATGLVVVGDLVGKGAAQEEAVVGETPNLAARLQELAEPGRVVISEATRRLIGTQFDLRTLEKSELRGIAEPVQAFMVLGERTTASRFEARGGPALLPMVGRDQELALLLERWSLAKAGEGQGVLLVGDAGIGKSRITRALLDALAEEPHIRLRYQCSPYHADSAFWPVIQQLTHATGLASDDPAEAKLDKLEALLARAVDDVGPVAPLIAALLGLDGEARYGESNLTPQVQRARTLEALVAQLLGLAAKQPVLLVLEDAHWIDPTTREFIDRCVDRIADSRVLVLLTSRPDQQPALAGHPHVTRFTLNRLGRAGVEGIVARLRGERELPADIVDTIIARTDGVPLFVEELTKAILESDETSIPASLHDSLMARLDRIPEVKEIAQIAACIGRDFSHGLLAAVTGRRGPDLAAAVDRLVGAELVFRRGTAPDATYSFKHALVRDAAYESLLKSRRQQVHGLILKALQHQGERSPEILGHHAENAGLRELAIGHWHQAAELASGRSAYREAARYHEHVLQVIAQLPERPELLERSIDTRLDLRNCLVPLGEPQRALHFAREAAALADRLNDAHRRARASSYLSIMLLHVGTPHEGLPFGREAVERASRLPDIGLEVSSRFYLGQVHHALGDHVEARHLYEQVIAKLSGDQLYDRYGLPFLPASHARAWLTLILAELGDFETGKRIGSEAVQISEEANQPFSLQQACWGLGLLYLRQGEHSRSLALMERAMAVTRNWGLDVWHAAIASSLGMLRALAGEVDAGIDLAEEAVRDMEDDRNSSIWHVQASISLARGYLVAGRADEAMARTERALTLARERRQVADEAWALHQQGEIMIRSDHPEAEHAGTSFRQALSRARELGMRPLEAHCTLGLALVDQARGEQRQAAISIRRALEIYRDLAMPVPEADTRRLARRMGLMSDP